jgi:hypothetical protein
VEGLGYPVRWGTALVPLIFAAEVVDGWTGWWSLLRHGKIWLLLLTEFINSGEVSPVLSMAVEAAPSCGAVGRRRSLFNLLAGVPIWRPFCNSVMAFIVAPASSGFVPDDVADGRGMECIFFSGGVGLDCVFNTLLEVLHVKVDGLVVFIFSVEVIRVKCNPTE